MKLRVHGYTEHRLKDPYKFWSKLLDTKPRRKHKCVATYTYVSRIDEETLKFSYGWKYDEDAKKTVPDQESIMCTLTSNNVWAIVVPAKNVVPSHSSRLDALTGVTVGWNRKSFSMYENACRIYENWATSWPYTPGVQVYKGKVLNSEALVDRKRTIQRDAALDVKRKLKRIYDLAPIMVRLLEAEGDRKPLRYWQGRENLLKWVEEIDLENVNAMDAERAFMLGEATTQRRRTLITTGRYETDHQGRQRWTQPTWVDEPIAEWRHRCVVNGLRKIREQIYSKEGVYQYEPVS